MRARSICIAVAVVAGVVGNVSAQQQDNRTLPDCNELADFGKNPGLQTRENFFGKPFLEYTKSALIALAYRASPACAAKAASSEDRFHLGRAKDRILGQYRNLERERTSRNEPFDPRSTTPGYPNCSDIAALGAVDVSKFRDEARKSLFGRPAREYSTSDFARFDSLASICRTGFEDPNEARLLIFARQRLTDIKGMQAAEVDEEARSARATAEENARSNERERLKAGGQPVTKIDDAALLHDAKRLADIMFSPMLQADQGVYTGQVLLERQESSKALLGRLVVTPEQLAQLRLLGQLGALGNQRARLEEAAILPHYVLMRWMPNTHVLAARQLRLGQDIRVVAKYVGNQQYRTTDGGIRTMPVVELLYVSPAQSPP